MSLIRVAGRVSKYFHYDRPAFFQVRRHQGELECFCLFIGYPRSQHSLLAQLINAHPDVAIADELLLSREFHLPNVMEPYTTYKSRAKFFQQILAKSLYDARHRTKKIFGDYTYIIPNQWQGKIRRLKVIGDKCAYEMTQLIHAGRIELEDLSQFVQLPLKIFHVVRNPFDVISRRHLCRTQYNMPNAGIDFLIREHFDILCPTVMRVMASMPKSVLILYAEEVIQDPIQNLSKALEFLCLESNQQYLEDCASIVFSSSKKSRYLCTWSSARIKQVEEEMKQVPFLTHYSFADS